MNMKKVFFWLLRNSSNQYFIIYSIWLGSTYDRSNKDDVKAVTELLEKVDTTDAKVTDITFSPLEGMTDETGKKIDIQAVEYNLVLDTLTTNHLSLIHI